MKASELRDKLNELIIAFGDVSVFTKIGDNIFLAASEIDDVEFIRGEQWEEGEYELESPDRIVIIGR